MKFREKQSIRAAVFGVQKFFRFLLGVSILLALLGLSSCKGPASSIILDTDIGSSTDDLFALQLLYHYIETENVKLLGIIVDRENVENAHIVDVMNNYYKHENIPIGLIQDGIKDSKVWIDYKNLPNYTNENGKPMFKKSSFDSYPEGYKIYRKLLSSQPDKSVKICSIGFLTCLSQLLQSQADEYSDMTGVELVRRKVSRIYIMGGVFGNAIEKTEYNFFQAIDYVLNFFSLLPADVEVILSPGEVGDLIDYKVENVISDIDWTDTHPIKQVYLQCDVNTGQKMWDVLPIIHAVKGDDWFNLSPRGTVEVTPNAETRFTPNPKGNIRYQIPGDDKWAEKIFAEIKKSYGKK